MVQLVVLGGPPTTAGEAFSVLQKNKIVGLLRLDLLTVLVMPLYYLLFFGLFAALRRVDAALATLSTVLGCAGVTLVLATPTALPMLALSEKHAAATSEPVRAQLQAAGEAILAADIWHGTGAIVGGILLLCGSLLVSAVMLRSRIFSRTIAYIGLVTFALDLAHTVAGHFVPAAGVVFMALAGPLYLIWFPLAGRRLLQIGVQRAC
jgi:hypothetical protein